MDTKDKLIINSEYFWKVELNGRRDLIRYVCPGKIISNSGGIGMEREIIVVIYNNLAIVAKDKYVIHVSEKDWCKNNYTYLSDEPIDKEIKEEILKNMVLFSKEKEEYSIFVI